MEEEEVIAKEDEDDADELNVDSNVDVETNVEENLTTPELPEIISDENSDGSVNRCSILASSIVSNGLNSNLASSFFPIFQSGVHQRC